MIIYTQQCSTLWTPKRLAIELMKMVGGGTIAELSKWPFQRQGKCWSKPPKVWFPVLTENNFGNYTLPEKTKRLKNIPI